MTLSPASCELIEAQLDTIFKLTNSLSQHWLLAIDNLDANLLTLSHAIHTIRSEIAYNATPPTVKPSRPLSPLRTATIDDL